MYFITCLSLFHTLSIGAGFMNDTRTFRTKPALALIVCRHDHDHAMLHAHDSMQGCLSSAY